MRGARTDYCGEVHLAGREADLPHLPAVNIDRRIRIEVLHIQDDAPAGPILGDGDGAFVPSALNLAEILVRPARGGVKRLIIALQVILDAGPARRHLSL